MSARFITTQQGVGVTLRPAIPDDLDVIMQLIRELADYEKLSHAVDAERADVAAALFGAQPKVFCDLVEWRGEPAGFAVWFYSFSTFRGRHGIYLEDLFVRPAYRGQGLGKMLLRALARRCIAERLPRFEWSVLKWNVPSIAFYEAQGATRLDDWTGCRLTGEALARLGTDE